MFAKAAIDAGADAFLGTGVHVLRGIEIYKGRPIFYGLGEFFRQMDVVGLSGMGSIGRGETRTARRSSTRASSRSAGSTGDSSPRSG